MANLSQQKRQRMLAFLQTLREEHKNDNGVLIALGEIESELNAKKYGLVWEQHEEAVDVQMRTQIPVFTEDTDREITCVPGGTCNFLLEGDNLHSLRLLEKTHRGRIDVIYIDPPYNTGSEDFKYDDNFIDVLDGYRHSKWLSFMSPRLKMARSLLADDGIIMISIDDNEYAQLKVLCDEIFGEQNRLSIHHIQVRYDNKTLNEKNDWQPVMEYVLIYAKNASMFHANKPTEEYSIDKFIFEFEELTAGETFFVKGRKVTVFKKGEWKLIKHPVPARNLLKETWVSGSIYTGTGNGTMVQNVIEPRVQTDGYGSLYKIDGLGEDGLGYRYFTGPQKEGATRSKMFSGIPIARTDDLEQGGAVKYKSISNIYDFSADFGNIRHEGGMPFNTGKKPVKMLKMLINYHQGKDITVLDFFAGSGSTGHAVLDLNAEDGGTRKFILCTNNESHICTEVTYPRLTNVIKGYGKYAPLPANLKYYRTCFVSKDEEYLSEALMEHISEMIQLENGVKLDGQHYIMVLDDDEADALASRWGEYTDVKSLYVSKNVLFTTEQNTLFRDVEIHIIPDYYFNFELREVGETW